MGERLQCQGRRNHGPIGTPLALEDHAGRGCYAGLRMQESVTDDTPRMLQRSHRVSIKIRVGLASGEIVEHIINNDPNRDNNVVGQTAWLASRMEQMATPGSILATMETFDLAEGYVAMKPLGFVAVKGFPVPVQVHEVTGPGAARNRLHISTRRGLTRFVGRDIELQQLRRALRRGRDSGGQVVAIVGEAGVGSHALRTSSFIRAIQRSGWFWRRAPPPTPIRHLTCRSPDYSIIISRSTAMMASD